MKTFIFGALGLGSGGGTGRAVSVEAESSLETVEFMGGFFESLTEPK